METQVPGLSFQQILAGSAIVFYLMRWLKTVDVYNRFVTKFPAADRWVYRLIAGLLSLVAALGITSAVQGSAEAGWVISIGVPNLEALWTNFSTINWATIFAGQQLAYDATRRPAAMPHDRSADA